MSCWLTGSRLRRAVAVMSSHLPERQSPNTAELDAARILPSRLELRAEGLLDAAAPRPTAPTFRAYIPVVAAGVRPSTRRVYSSGWKRIENHWGERRIDEPTPPEIRQFLVQMQSELVIRRSGRGGHSDTSPVCSRSWACAGGCRRRSRCRTPGSD